MRLFEYGSRSGTEQKGNLGGGNFRPDIVTSLPGIARESGVGTPYGIRTRVTRLRIWRPRPLDERGGNAEVYRLGLALGDPKNYGRAW